jgi:hypothetical protein
MYDSQIYLCKRLLTLAFLILAALPLSAQLNVQVAIVGGQASGKTSDWVGQFRKNRVLVTVINPTINTYEGVLSVKLYGGDGTLLAETVAEQQQPIEITRGSQVLDLANVLPQNNPAAYRVPNRTLLDRFRSGFIPEDNYEICVDLVDIRTQNTLIGAPVCRNANVVAFQPPVLIYPPDRSEERANTRPVLRWNGVTPKPRGTVKYRLQVFEVIGDQSPEIAFRSNVPYVDEIIINQTQWIWGAAYELPRPEGRYVWNVQALDEEDKPIGEPEGRAVPFLFSVAPLTAADKQKKDEELLAEKPLEQGKIRFVGTVKDLVTKSRLIPDATVTIVYATSEIKYRTITETYTETVPGRRVNESITLTAFNMNAEIERLRREGRVITGQRLSAGRLIVDYYYMTPPTTAQKTRQVQVPYTEQNPKTAEVTTDGSGKFSIDIEDGQIISVTAKAKGYFDGKAEQISVQVPAGASVISGYSYYLAPRPGKIEGIVSDAQTRRGIQSVVVEAFSSRDQSRALASGMTDEAGKFSFDIDAADYVLKINETQYKPFTSRTVNVRPESTAKSDIELTPLTASVKGKITDRNSGDAIAGVKVAVYTQKDIDELLYGNKTNPVSREVNTDANGNYEISGITINKEGLETDKYVVVAQKNGYAMAHSAVALLAGKESTQADLTMLTRNSSLTGKVTDDNNEALANVTVDIYEADNSTLYKSLTTDGNGEYAVKELPADRKLGKIVFFRDGWSMETKTGVFAQFQTIYAADAQLTRNPLITLRGVVVNQNDEPIEGVKVSCENKSATTDKQGRFTIENTSERTHKEISFVKEGLESKNVKVVAKISPDWQIEETLLEYKRKLAIRFNDQTGNALNGVNFRLTAPDGKEIAKEKLSTAEWTGMVTGSPAWVGQSLKIAWTHPAKENEEQTISIDSKEWFRAKSPLSFTLIDKTVTIKGRITNKETNEAVADVTVSINGSNFSARTDANGNYTIAKAPFQANYQLKAEKRNFATNTLNISNSVKIEDVSKTLEIANQNFTVKQALIIPENIFGFKATVTASQEIGNEQFALDGTLEVPNGSEITTSSGKIDFKGLVVNKFGIPVKSSNSLDSKLPVRVFDIPGNMENVSLQYVNSSGNPVEPSQTGGIGVLTGTVSIASTSIRTANASLPAFNLFAHGNFPIGIRSAGTYDSLRAVVGKKTKIEFTGIETESEFGTLYKNQQIRLGVEFKVAQNDVTNAHATYQYAFGQWSEAAFSGALEIRVLTRDKKHLYTLRSQTAFDAESGDSELALANNSIRFFDDAKFFNVQNGATLPIKGGSKTCEIGDGAVDISADFSFMGMPVSITVAQGKTQFKSNNGFLEVIYSSKYFEDYFDNPPTISFALSAVDAVRIGLASEGIRVGGFKGRARGIDIMLNKLVYAFGSTNGDYFEFGGTVALSFGGNSANPINAAGSLDARLTWLNGNRTFTVNSVAVAFAVGDGFNLAGSVAFPSAGGIDGRFKLKVNTKSLGGVAIDARFRYVNPQDFAFALYAEASVPLVNIGPVGVIGIGGEIARSQHTWTIGITGKFVPVGSPASTVAATLTTRVVFGGGEFTLQGEGLLELAGQSFAQANVTIDFAKRTFAGNVVAAYERDPVLLIRARMNAVVDFNDVARPKFWVWGDAAATVMGNPMGAMHLWVSNMRGMVEITFDCHIIRTQHFNFGAIQGFYRISWGGRMYANSNFDIDARVFVDARIQGDVGFGPWCLGPVCLGRFTVGGVVANAGFNASLAVRGGRITNFAGNGHISVSGWIGFGDENCCGAWCNSVCADLGRWCHVWGPIWVPCPCARARGCFSASVSAGFDGRNWFARFN